MSLLAAAGASMLAAATLPQGWRLLRTRSARDFAWPFVLLNLVGLVLLSIRSAQIGERAFLAVNVLAALFWLLVVAVKAKDLRRSAPLARPSA